jgi:hypothetical protein
MVVEGCKNRPNIFSPFPLKMRIIFHTGTNYKTMTSSKTCYGWLVQKKKKNNINFYLVNRKQCEQCILKHRAAVGKHATQTLYNNRAFGYYIWVWDPPRSLMCKWIRYGQIIGGREGCQPPAVREVSYSHNLPKLVEILNFCLYL